MQSQRRGRRLGEEARVRCCWQQGTHRAPPKGRSWWGWGAEARPTRVPQRGQGWGARACSPHGSSLPSRPTPRLTASGTSAQVMMTTPERTPLLSSPLSQSSVRTALIIALHGGNPSRLPVSAHEWLSPLAKHSGPVMSRSLTQFPSLPPLPSNRQDPPCAHSTFSPSFLPLVTPFSPGNDLPHVQIYLKFREHLRCPFLQGAFPDSLQHNEVSSLF